MKILTMCQGGQVRSVGLKYLLTYKYGHDVIACGWESNSPETINMLCEWADAIIIMQPEFIGHIPPRHHGVGSSRRKLYCYDVGPDNYGNAFHQELQSKLDHMVKTHGMFYTTNQVREIARDERALKHLKCTS